MLKAEAKPRAMLYLTGHVKKPLPPYKWKSKLLFGIQEGDHIFYGTKQGVVPNSCASIA